MPVSNPSYLEVEIGELQFEASPDKNVTDTSPQKSNKAWCCMSVVLATWEVDVGESRPKAGPRQK
jgi:hypothetical protein